MILMIIAVQLLLLLRVGAVNKPHFWVFVEHERDYPSECLVDKKEDLFERQPRLGFVEATRRILFPAEIGKYIICVPQQGLMDMFHRIGNCLQYAYYHRRKVVMHTNFGWFNDDFTNYFVIDHPSRVGYVETRTLRFWRNQSEVPYFVHADAVSIGNQTFAGRFQSCAYTDSIHLDYARIVLFSHYGGGSILPLLRYGRFSRLVLDEFERRKQLLPRDYISCHIRNTDIKTAGNVTQFLMQYRGYVRHKVVFLATDHNRTFHLALKIWSESVVVGFTSLVDGVYNQHVGGGTLRTAEQSRLYNVNTLADLLLLANSYTFIYPSLRSGFTSTAHDLFTRKNLLKDVTSTRQQQAVGRLMDLALF